jgi:hypothetical protein
MENHPIPQDITGFQFKLIGDMTVKQFAYVAIGAILAWVLFILPIFAFIKIPLALVCGLFGVSLAFVPISGRPMDVMIGNFLKSVFNPTQYVYQKQSASIFTNNLAANASAQILSEDQLKKFLDKLPKSKNKLDKKESVFFQQLSTYSNPQTANLQPAPIPPHYYATLKPKEPVKQEGVVEKQSKTNDANSLSNQELLRTAALLEKELSLAKATEQKQNQVDPEAFLATHEKVLDLQDQLNNMLSQKKELEERLVTLQRNLQTDNKPAITPTVANEQPEEEKIVLARSIPQGMTKSVGLPQASEFPNVLSGIVKDPRGNPLGNILVEVKDKEGNAVRAFKTSALGQFASATPLNNGDYTIEFEDPNSLNKFEKVAFQALGQVILPIEIISTDQREELRRSLFN